MVDPLRPHATSEISRISNSVDIWYNPPSPIMDAVPQVISTEIVNVRNAGALAGKSYRSDSNSSINRFIASIRSRANLASVGRQFSGGDRYAELDGSRRARAIELIETPAAKAISSAVMRRVRMSVASLKSIVRSG